MRLLRDREGDFKDVSTLVQSLGVIRRTREIRLRSARQLLESTDLTIAEIAGLVANQHIQSRIGYSQL